MNSKSPALRQTDPRDLAWAREKLKDVEYHCILNFKLKRAGIWHRYLHEMSDDEHEQYKLILRTLLEDLNR